MVLVQVRMSCDRDPLTARGLGRLSPGAASHEAARSGAPKTGPVLAASHCAFFGARLRPVLSLSLR
jgi:hypothetical protein